MPIRKKAIKQAMRVGGSAVPLPRKLDPFHHAPISTARPRTQVRGLAIGQFHELRALHPRTNARIEFSRRLVFSACSNAKQALSLWRRSAQPRKATSRFPAPQNPAEKVS